MYWLGFFSVVALLLCGLLGCYGAWLVATDYWLAHQPTGNKPRRAEGRWSAQALGRALGVGPERVLVAGLFQPTTPAQPHAQPHAASASAGWVGPE